MNSLGRHRRSIYFPKGEASWVRFFLGAICVASAFLFPFAEGPSRDALSQLFSLAALSMGALLLGLGSVWWGFLLFTGILLLSMALTPTPYLGGKVAGMAALVLFGIGGCVGAGVRSNRAGLVWFLVAIVASATVNAAEGLLQWLGLVGDLWPWVVEPEQRGMAVGALRQRNLLATYLSVGIVCTTWLFRLRRISESFAWCIAGILVWGAVASGSRTGALEILILAACGFLWRGQFGRAETRLMVGQVPLYIFANFALPIVGGWHGIESVSSLARAAESTHDGRIAIWSNALALIKERPWSGWGWLDMGYGHYATIFTDRFDGILQNAHNLPLQIAVEFGLPLAVALICALAYLLYRAMTPSNLSDSEANEPRETSRYAWVMLLMILGVHSLLEYPLWYVNFLFLTGVLLGYLLPSIAGREQARLQIWSIRAVKLGAVAAVVLAAIGWQQYDKVLNIARAPFNDRHALREAVSDASGAWLFQGYIDSAKLGLTVVTHENAEASRLLAEKQLHFFAEPRVIRSLLYSLWLLDRRSEFQFHSVRFCLAFSGAYRRWLGDIVGSPMVSYADALNEQCQPNNSRN